MIIIIYFYFYFHYCDYFLIILIIILFNFNLGGQILFDQNSKKILVTKLRSMKKWFATMIFATTFFLSQIILATNFCILVINFGELMEHG